MPGMGLEFPIPEQWTETALQLFPPVSRYLETEFSEPRDSGSLQGVQQVMGCD